MDRILKPFKFFNSLTAALCDDYQAGPPEIKTPKCRVIARGVLAMVFFVILLIVSVLLARQQPILRTERKWGREFPALQFSPYVNPSSGSITAPANSEISNQDKLICPCSVAYFSWTEYVTFYTISKPDPEGVVETKVINSSRSFLQASSGFKKSQFMNQTNFKTLMQNMIGSVIDKSDERTNFVSTNLFNPRTLGETIELRILANLYTEKTYSLNQLGNATSQYLTKVYYLWKAPVSHSLKKQGRTDMDFWKAASKEPWAVFVDPKAIGMRINWTKYLEKCSPPYCDVVLDSGRIYRFLQAVAILGGFITVLLLLVKRLLWPLICCIMGIIGFDVLVDKPLPRPSIPEQAQDDCQLATEEGQLELAAMSAQL